MKSKNVRNLWLAASTALLLSMNVFAQETEQTDAPAAAEAPVAVTEATAPDIETAAPGAQAAQLEGKDAPAGASDSTAAEVPNGTGPDEDNQAPAGLVAYDESEDATSAEQSASKVPQPASSPVVLNRTPTNAPSGTAASVATSSTLFSVMLALVAVVVMIFGTAWFIKRFTGLSPLNNRQIKIVASLPVGARERVVLVEIGEEQLLLGVTPQQISHLHTLKEPLVTVDKPGNSDFAQRLQAMLSKGRSE